MLPARAHLATAAIRTGWVRGDPTASGSFAWGFRGCWVCRQRSHCGSQQAGQGSPSQGPYGQDKMCPTHTWDSTGRVPQGMERG